MTRRTAPRPSDLVAILLLAMGLALPAQADGDDSDEGHESNQAIIELKPDESIDLVVADYEGVEVVGSFPTLNMHLLLLPEVMSEEQFEAVFEDDPRIDDAELNHTSDVSEGQTQSFFVMVGEPEFGAQYARERIGLDLAHAAADGSGVVVAVLDSGLDVTHPLLAGLVAPGGYNFVDGNGDVSDVGIEGVAGHGTFMAGVIAMVAPQVSILPLKVLDDAGQTNAFRMAEAMLYAVEHGADVINLSLGAAEENTIFEDVLENVRDQGVLVIGAAGNNDEEHLLYPAAEDDAMGIAATDAADIKADFSNYDEPGDLAMSAPGVGIVSTVPVSAEGMYGEWEGTSISTAFVAGAAALVKSANPDLDARGMESILLATQAPLPPQEELEGGRLDAGAAASWARGDFGADGVVDIDDLVQVILGWGECDSSGACDGDATGDGIVGVADVVVVLLNWG